MKTHMRSVIELEPEAQSECSFKIETAKASLRNEWIPHAIIAGDSHWRTTSVFPTPAPPAFASWIKGPIFERKWARVREDGALAWMLRNASDVCKLAISTVMPLDVTRPMGGWLGGMATTRLLAQIAYDNGGALVQALAPGCGKITLIKTFTQVLKDNGLVAKKDVCYDELHACCRCFSGWAYNCPFQTCG